MPSNPFFEAMFADLMDPQELAQIEPQGQSLMAPMGDSRAVFDTGRDKPANAVYGKTDRPLPKGDVFPESPKPTFADGGIVASDGLSAWRGQLAAEEGRDNGTLDRRGFMQQMNAALPEDIMRADYMEALDRRIIDARGRVGRQGYTEDVARRHQDISASWDDRPLMQAYQNRGTTPIPPQNKPSRRRDVAHADGFADGGLMAPDQTYLAPQADGDMEEVPPGATPNGVKDDIDIKISEGEIVVPEDVARWHGLKWFMEARHEAKEGLALMASEGLIKKPQGVVEANTMPSMGSGLMTPEGEDEMATGGVYIRDNEGNPEGAFENPQSINSVNTLDPSAYGQFGNSIGAIGTAIGGPALGAVGRGGFMGALATRADEELAALDIPGNQYGLADIGAYGAFGNAAGAMGYATPESLAAQTQAAMGFAEEDRSNTQAFGLEGKSAADVQASLGDAPDNSTTSSGPGNDNGTSGGVGSGDDMATGGVVDTDYNNSLTAMEALMRRPY